MSPRSAATRSGRVWDTRLVRAGAVFCCVLWGTAFPCMEVLYQGFQVSNGRIAGQLLLAGIRFAGAGLLLLAAEGLTGHHPLRHPPITYCRMAGFGLLQTFAQYALFYLSMNWLAGGRASLVNTSNAFFSVLLAHFFCTNDRLNGRKAAGCLLGAAGLVLLCGTDGASASPAGDLLMLASALTFAIGNVLSARLTQHLRPLTLTGWQMLFGGGALCLCGLCGGAQLSAGTPAGWAALLYLLVQSAAAFALWSALLARAPVSLVGMHTCIVPAVGVCTSALLPGAPPLTIRTLLSLLLIVLGVVCVNMHSRNRGLSE